MIPSSAPGACPLCHKAACTCGSTPAAPAQQPARTFVKHGAYMICSACKLAAQYCNCNERAQAAEKQSDDGPAAASLEQRAKECKP